MAISDGVHGGTRIRDLLIHSQPLYSTELHAQMPGLTGWGRPGRKHKARSRIMPMKNAIRSAKADDQRLLPQHKGAEGSFYRSASSRAGGGAVSKYLLLRQSAAGDVAVVGIIFYHIPFDPKYECYGNLHKESPDCPCIFSSRPIFSAMYSGPLQICFSSFCQYDLCADSENRYSHIFYTFLQAD